MLTSCALRANSNAEPENTLSFVLFAATLTSFMMVGMRLSVFDVWRFRGRIPDRFLRSKFYEASTSCACASGTGSGLYPPAASAALAAARAILTPAVEAVSRMGTDRIPAGIPATIAAADWARDWEMRPAETAERALG